MLVRTCKA